MSKDATGKGRRPTKPHSDAATHAASAVFEVTETPIHENAKTTRAILEAGLKVPENVATPEHVWVEDRLGPFPDEPKAQRPPLLPTRWWDHADAAMEPQPRDPILVVSHQVAQVLNMGIDRAVDVGERAKADKEWAEGQAARYRREYEWLREFMRNVRDRIGPIDDDTDMFTRGHREFVVDLARSIDLLEKGLPR